jgi:hypothetical protein
MDITINGVIKQIVLLGRTCTAVNIVLERHTVWYSEYNFCIFLYDVYILQHVSTIRGHHQVIYIHSFYINLTLFFATPTLANVYINGGRGCCLQFGVCFHQ